MQPTRSVWPRVFLLSLGGFFEYYDLFLTGYISPALIRQGIFRGAARGLFGLSDQAGFAAATFAGLFFGTIAFSRIADRFGRRPIFTFSLLWYSGATLAMAAQHTLAGVDLCRFLAGLGIGVELVTIDAYLVELVPTEMRGRAFAFNSVVQFLAVPAVALTCWLLVPTAPLGIAGWRWVLALGATGAIAVWFLRRGLPESEMWRRRPRRLTGEKGAGGVASTLWRPPYRRRMILLIVFNFFQTIGFYGFANWLPAFLADRGATFLHSLEYSFIIALAYPVGPLLGSAVADRFELKWQIVASALGIAVFGLLFAGQGAPAGLIFFGVLVTLANCGMSYAFHAYQAELFPTEVRARAVGFCYSWSRFSTIFNSFLIAFFLERFGTPGVFAFIAASMAVVTVSIGAFGPRTRGLALEKISSS